MRVITFGTFDLFHVGHANIFLNIHRMFPGAEIIVGVSSDKFNNTKKARVPVFDQEARRRIVSAIQGVSVTFFEESLALKRHYILKYKADVLVMGSDWEGKFDGFRDICQVVYFPRTTGVSTTDIIRKIFDHV